MKFVTAGVIVSLEFGKISGDEASSSVDICVVVSVGAISTSTTVTLTTVGGSATSMSTKLLHTKIHWLLLALCCLHYLMQHPVGLSVIACIVLTLCFCCVIMHRVICC